MIENQIQGMLSEFNVCADMAQSVALTDIIMSQINEIPLELLTQSAIQKIIEQEVWVNIKMNSEDTVARKYFN